MKLPVLIEPVGGNGFRARCGEPLGLTAEAPTPDEAVRKLQELVEARVSAGTLFTEIDVPDAGNPWLRGAGMFKGDPLFEEWQQAIAERRRQLDADPDVP
jgi:hypothetical protein